MLCYNGLADDAKANEHKARLSALQGRRIGASHHRPYARRTPRQQRAAGDSRTRQRRAGSGATEKITRAKGCCKNGAARWREARRWAIISRNDSN